MSKPLSKHDEVIQALLKDLRKARLVCRENATDEAEDQNEFVPRSKIDELLTNNVVDSVLRASCREPYPNVRNVLKHCPRALCILLENGHIQHLPSFLRHPELRDDKLPLLSEPDQFPKGDKIWDQFFKLQWQYCPVKLDDTSTEFGERYIFPFLQKDFLEGGSSAKLYSVTLAREYDSLSNERNAVDSLMEHRQFALKTYMGSNAVYYYNNEVENFRRLNEVDDGPPIGLIGFHTGFQHGKTYNILLDLANGGNLHDFMLKTDPPATGKQIFEFWKALLEVLKALDRIHDIPEDPHDEGRKVFQGLHQDIRPKNLLVFIEPGPDVEDGSSENGPKYSFKLADLGISHFTLANEGSRDASVEDTMGSQTFGAPETFRESEHEQRSRFMITRSIDIWSIGCVLLVVAVWIAYGKQGVDKFRLARLAENKRNQSNARFCFHNGNKSDPRILNVVQNYLETLHNELNRADITTEQVIQHLVVRMIEPNSRSRPTAASAVRDADRLLKAAEAKFAAHPNLFEPRTAFEEHTGVFHQPGQSMHMPSGLPHRHASTRSQMKTPLTPPSRSMLTEPIEGHGVSPGLFSYYTGGNIQAQPPQTPPLSLKRPTSGTRHSVPAVGDFTTSPISTSPTPFTATTSMTGRIHEEPLDEAFQDATEHSQRSTSRPGHVARSSDPVLPHGGILQPSQTTGFPSPGAMYNHPPKNPYISVDKALKYIKDRRKIWKSPKLDHDHYREFIKGRDHLFLIDNGISMKDYEKHVLLIAEVLLYFASEADPNGVDIYCTNLDRRAHGKDYKDLLGYVKNWLRAAKGMTDMKVKLGSILAKYRGDLEAEGRGVNKMSIYVLTDGLWTKNGLDDVEAMIKETVNVLKKFDMRSEQLGIQFVTFGDDKEALAKLDLLDNLGKDPSVGLDIVDATDHRRNVLKMLLGSWDKTFDEDERPDTPNRSYTLQ